MRAAPAQPAARCIATLADALALRFAVHYIQKCASYRLGGILVANQPGCVPCWDARCCSALCFRRLSTHSQLRRRCSFVKFLLALVKPFMSNKLKDRVLLLGKELTVFSQEMDPAQLPPCVTHAAAQHQSLRVHSADEPPRVPARREFGGTLEEDPMCWFDEQIALEAAGH